MLAKKVVVVGYGMAAQRLLEVMAEECHHDNVGIDEIVVVSNEGSVAYDRVNLAAALHDETTLPRFTPPTFPEKIKISYLHDSAEALNVKSNCIELAKGGNVTFDALVLATGSQPVRPPIANASLGHVFRNLDDARAIAAKTKTSEKGLIIGGGLMGIELARHLHDLGIKVTIIERGAYLLPLQMDAAGAEVIAQTLRALGIEVLTNVQISEILSGQDGMTGVRLDQGVDLSADMLIFATGIRPNDALAKAAGLATGPRGGIVVDAYCQTSQQHVFAIGDCALFNDQITGLVAPAYLMAASVAKALCSGDVQKVALPALCAKLKLTGCDAVSFGDSRAVTAGAQAAVLQVPSQKIYRKLVTSGDGNHLLGGILVGDTSKYSEHLHYVNSHAALEGRLSTLLMPQQTGAADEQELPDSAVICSCRNVTRGDLIKAIRTEGCTSVADIKLHTQAGTGCGGCVPALAEILDRELKKTGQAKPKVLCEHFACTRQALFEMIHQNQLRTWTEILARFGSGEGCEVCKPVVASILASLWNEHVLESGLAGLQDTNDAFLANIQKDGTYSVIPRVAGGEIDPEKIGQIGVIGLKYGLYCKITGGQRIDLLGARIDDLPSIWKELIEAGFESGHAYGKALRTVKSCVGSRWCRFGVQDSTAMAIELENRYRGLRSPHKIKSAVSGCTRECAEAQNKDFGLIATQKGWNLYVCGNGAKPQHAQLLVKDIDSETVFKYVDRFLMYYIRTADKLERTASWLNKLEGGIAFLQKVVVEDSLGIGEELEKEMASLRKAYRCEWAETLKDPRKVKRFRTYINADRDQTDTPVIPGVWLDVCEINDVLPNTGVCALVGKKPVAIFRLNRRDTDQDEWFGLDNIDPFSKISVLSRGLLGDQAGEPKVASPIYKQSFSLRTGACLNNPEIMLQTWQVRVNGNRIEVMPQ